LIPIPVQLFLSATAAFGIGVLLSLVIFPINALLSVIAILAVICAVDGLLFWLMFSGKRDA